MNNIIEWVTNNWPGLFWAVLFLVIFGFMVYDRGKRWSFRYLERDDRVWLHDEPPLPLSRCCNKAYIPWAVQENFLVIRCPACEGMWFTPILGKREL